MALIVWTLNAKFPKHAKKFFVKFVKTLVKLYAYYSKMLTQKWNHLVCVAEKERERQVDFIAEVRSYPSL
jgi:hypothetical protein